MKSINSLPLVLFVGAFCGAVRAADFYTCQRETEVLQSNLELVGLWHDAVFPNTNYPNDFYTGNGRPLLDKYDWDTPATNTYLDEYKAACSTSGGLYKELDIYTYCPLPKTAAGNDGPAAAPLDMHVELNNAPFCFGKSCTDMHYPVLVQNEAWADPLSRMESFSDSATALIDTELKCYGGIFNGDISTQWGCPSKAKDLSLGFAEPRGTSPFTNYAVATEGMLDFTGMYSGSYTVTADFSESQQAQKAKCESACVTVGDGGCDRARLFRQVAELPTLYCTKKSGGQDRVHVQYQLKSWPTCIMAAADGCAAEDDSGIDRMSTHDLAMWGIFTDNSPENVEWKCSRFPPNVLNSTPPATQPPQRGPGDTGTFYYNASLDYNATEYVPLPIEKIFNDVGVMYRKKPWLFYGLFIGGVVGLIGLVVGAGVLYWYMTGGSEQISSMTLPTSSVDAFGGDNDDRGGKSSSEKKKRKSSSSSGKKKSKKGSRSSSAGGKSKSSGGGGGGRDDMAQKLLMQAMQGEGGGDGGGGSFPVDMLF